MGYYVDGDGYIKTNPDGTRMFLALLEEANNPLEARNCGENDETRDGYWQVWNHDKYYDDYIYNFLEKITPYTKSGEIEFVGENNEAWRFHFRNGKWYEDAGKIIYEEGNPI